MQTAPGQGQQQDILPLEKDSAFCGIFPHSFLWPGQNKVFPRVGISSPNTIWGQGLAAFGFIVALIPWPCLWVTGVQASKGSGCFPSTSGENSLLCRSLPPVPCDLKPLNPNASPGHLTPTFTTESSGLLRCPSIKTPILNQRKPLGSPWSQHSRCCLAGNPLTPFFSRPFNPMSGQFPGAKLLAWQYSASWSAYAGPPPRSPMVPHRRTIPPARGSYT